MQEKRIGKYTVQNKRAITSHAKMFITDSRFRMDWDAVRTALAMLSKNFLAVHSKNVLPLERLLLGEDLACKEAQFVFTCNWKLLA